MIRNNEEEMTMTSNTQTKTTNRESNLQADTLNDLPVTDEQAKETRGGSTTITGTTGTFRLTFNGATTHA